jgi:hypothetical protein
VAELSTTSPVAPLIVAVQAPGAGSGPVTPSTRQPVTIGTPRLRATSARWQTASPERVMTPRAPNSNGASAGTGRSTSKMASRQSRPMVSCGRQATNGPVALPGAAGSPATTMPSA